MTPRPLHILQVHGWWKVDRPGGIITMMKTLTTALEARGHKVTILASDWNARQVTGDEEDGRPFHKLRLPKPPEARYDLKGWLSWYLSLRRAVTELKRFTAREQVDIVHLHYPFAYQWAFRLLHEAGGPPYIVTLHRGEVTGYGDEPPYCRRLMSKVYEGAGRRIAVSEWLAREGEKVFSPGYPAQTIYNGIDAGDFKGIEDAPVPARFASDLPERYFIMLANLHPYKGQDVAIRAWKDVVERHPGVHLVLTGSGAIEGELRSLVSDLGLDGKVHFIGHVPRRDALILGKHAIGLLAPSRNEGFGYMLVEAGLLGIPIAASAIQPFVEYLTDGETALLVENEDHEGLAQAATRLIENDELRTRLASKMRRKVETDFLAPVMAERYEAAYREAMASE